MKRTTLALTIIAAAMSGCSYQAMKSDVDVRHGNTEKEIFSSIDKMNAPEAKQRQLFSKSSKSWLGGKSVPLAQEAQLPAVFSKNVTLIFPGRVNLRTVADRVTKSTGIPVSLKPDVFMPTSMFIGTGGSAGAMPIAQPMAAPNMANLPILPPLPGIVSLGASAYQNIQNTADEFELNYSGPLTGLLNQIASRFGVNWEYSESSGVMFSRLVTKTFVVKANPGDSSFTASLGKGSSASSTGSFSSDGQVKINSSFSVWDGVQKAIESIKTQAGKFHISQATGSITITDTKAVVDMAEKIINSENLMLTKQVAVRMEMFSVTSTDSVEEGVDWNVVYTKFSQLLPQFTLSLVSPASLVSAAAGGAGLSILSPIPNGSTGSFSGTDAFIRALQGQAKVVRVQSVSVMTLNRQPVPMGVTNQQSYLASTSAGTTGINGVASQPGLTPGQVTTGFLANMLPTVLDSNSVLLQFSMDLTELKKIGIVSVGSGVTQQSIQTPDVDGVQFVQRVALKSGSTLVLTGFEKTRDSYDQQGLTQTVGLGGSIVAKKNRESIVIMITPIIVDGAV